MNDKKLLIAVPAIWVVIGLISVIRAKKQKQKN